MYLSRRDGTWTVGRLMDPAMDLDSAKTLVKHISSAVRDPRIRTRTLRILSDFQSLPTGGAIVIPFCSVWPDQ